MQDAAREVQVHKAGDQPNFSIRHFPRFGRINCCQNELILEREVAVGVVKYMLEARRELGGILL